MSLCDSCVKGRPLGMVYSACPSRSPTVWSCTGHRPTWTPPVAQQKGGDTHAKQEVQAQVQEVQKARR